jgi:hypothetical protein
MYCYFYIFQAFQIHVDEYRNGYKINQNASNAFQKKIYIYIYNTSAMF